MSQSIRILIVEDRDVDAEIVLRELRRAGFDPAWTRVQTEDAYLEHLRPDLDLILSDFQLPGFTGRRALELLQERKLRVPFIVVSGTIGEDTAVAMMKQGATDYLLKDRLARLGEAVRRALQEVKEREARERVESALRASDERFRKVFEYAPTGIVICDAAGHVQRCNPAYCALLAVNEEEILGRHVTERVHADDRTAEQVEIQRLHEAPRPLVELHNRNLRDDGTVVWLQKFVSLLRGKPGEPPHVLILVADITERRQAEEMLREAKAAAEAASLRKDLFLAMLSHELRTPLTPVLLTLGSLNERRDLPPEVSSDLSMMERNIALEVRLIDQLLDVSQITCGKIDLKPEAVDLNQAVSDVCGICKSQLNDRELKFEADLQTNLSLIQVDPARLRQVLWNVIGNAIKFTPDGGEIHVKTRQLLDGQAQVQVADTGIGIESEAMPLLFEPFEQAEKRMTRKYGGLGLGLAISRAIVEQHGGTIRAESNGQGQGSVFTVTLPAGAGKTAEVTVLPVPQREPAVPALRLLIVEDHLPTARALERMLERSGHAVSVAGTVVDALRQANNQTFDLLISDIGLPDGDGYELMSRLRQTCPIPGIAMSGFGMEEDIRRSREAGFHAHLIKPVDPNKLRRVIADLWERRCLRTVV